MFAVNGNLIFLPTRFYACGIIGKLPLRRGRERVVAQFGRALRSGRRGRRFKSCQPDQTCKAVLRGGLSAPAAFPTLSTIAVMASAVATRPPWCLLGSYERFGFFGSSTSFRNIKYPSHDAPTTTGFYSGMLPHSRMQRTASP